MKEGKQIIICEVGQNHLGKMTLARTLIKLAKENGGDLVKLQLYNTDTLYEKGTELYEQAKEAELSFEQARMLFDYGQEIGMEVFFSVFDVEKIDWCERIGVKRYKIAYSQKDNMELKVACWQTHKPILLSTNSPYEAAGDYLLYCIPHYPTNLDELHFNGVDWERFTGFSDHTINLDAAKIALARGAQIIEKHFCLSRYVGVDGMWSMTPEELKELVRWANVVKEVW